MRVVKVRGVPGVEGYRLQQVFCNILSNAVKFTPPGGSVLVRIEEQEGSLAVTVADTGLGLAPDFTRELLAELFQHAARTCGRPIRRRWPSTFVGKRAAPQDLLCAVERLLAC